MTSVAVRRVLISVYDKRGVVELARRLADAGVEIVSSGGTASALLDAGIDVTEVSEVTGASEMLDGRVKTLHPAIHGGLLADLDKESHRAELEARGVKPFQLLVSNLYPFRETVVSGATTEEVIEKIDIGGPAMIRSAAKNHAWVGVVTSPGRYAEVADAVASGGLSLDLRIELAAEAFYHTASYDAAIVSWFHRDEAVPERIVTALERVSELRYGENPHQIAAIFRGEGRSWWEQADQKQGTGMSFNNYADAEAAARYAAAFDEPTVAVIKHANACGVASADEIAGAFEAAWACDPLSAFGGVIAMNRPLDAATADAMKNKFIEVVIAPGLDDDGAEILAAKKRMRVLIGAAPGPLSLDVRQIEGGALIQTGDPLPDDMGEWRTVSDRAPTEAEMADLAFAWTVCARTRSNSIVIAKDRAAIGIGAGDQSRVGASERAVTRAGERAAGAVAASEALLPFRDGLDALAGVGVSALVQPGGSKRDQEVIDAANEHGMALVFTGTRHFLH